MRALAARIGVDRTVGLSLATRGIQGAATVAMLALVVTRLSPADQGFFLTMNSLGALQLLAELGLAYALMQVTSHLPPTTPAASLRALRAGARARNAATTVGGGAVVWVVGWLLLNAPAAHTASSVRWLWPWTLQVVAVLLYQQAFPSVAIAEGRGQTERVWRWRAEQELAAGVGMVAGLLGGLGIASIAAGFAARVAHALVARHRFVVAEADASDVPAASLAGAWSAIHQLQWRLAATSIAALVLLQLFGPLLFAVGGPVIAGRVGLAMVLGNGVFGVTTAWLVSQAPILGRDFAAGRLDRMDADFALLLRRSLGFAIALALGVVAAVALTAAASPTLAPRLPPLAVLVPALAAAVAQHVVFAHATRLRASGREPLLGLYVIGAAVTAVTMALVALRGSAVAVALAYLLLALVGVALASRTSRRERSAWTAQRAGLAGEAS